MQPGQGRFSSCTAAAPAQPHSSALPWLTETHGAAASINGALCSCVPRCHHPPLPMLKGSCVCTISRWAGASWGTKHGLFPLAEPGAPPAWVRAGDSECEVVCESSQQGQGAGQARGPKDTCSLIRCALGHAPLSPHLGTWDLPSQLLFWALSALQKPAEKRQGISSASSQTTSL